MKTQIMRKNKWIQYAVLAFGLGAAQISCSEADFLRYPIDDITEGAFFTGPENVRQMLNSAYTGLRDHYGDNLYYVVELPTDNAYMNAGQNSNDHLSLNLLEWQTTNGRITSTWETAYQVIARAHLTMAQAEILIEDDALKTRYINEAKYLRALMYFNLVRLFGDLPLILKDVTNPDELFEYGREARATVLAQVIADLKDASALPMRYTDNADIGYATGAAAKALLGEVYLTMHNYDEARKVLEELVTISGPAAGYGLMDNYADVFQGNFSNNKEILFAVQYARGFDPAMSNGLFSAGYPNETVYDMVHPQVPRGAGTWGMTRDIYLAFDPADPRRDLIQTRVSTAMTNQPIYVFTMKYYDNNMSADRFDSGNDIVVHRWADVLLMYAEALNETGATGTALTYLSEVRSRAGLTTDAALGGDKDAMFLALEKERRLELFMEGHRWFDLVRTGRAQAVIDAHMASEQVGITGNPAEDPLNKMDIHEKGTGRKLESYRLLFPIPETQRAIYPDVLTQNPGY
jgi:tetratricopeptide (TPR) repeat protein